MSLTILELFAQHLNVNGDTGNGFVLRTRLGWSGIHAEVVPYDIGGELPATAPDVVTLGHGPLSAQRAIADDLARIAPTLRAWAAAGVPFLAVNGGFQLVGEALVLEDGTRIAGAGLVDLTVELGAKRHVGKSYVVDSAIGRLVGVENQGATVRLGDGVRPLGAVALGSGNRVAGGEGVHHGNVIGTYLHGPVLAVNPLLADHLAGLAAERAGLEYPRTADHDRVDLLALETRRTLLAGTGLHPQA